MASGDPDQHSFVLWTRVSLPGLTRVDWELSTSAEFTRIAQRGTALTGPERDHPVKIVVSGLKPGSSWFYRFRAGGQTSPVGRARTLPAGKLSRLGIALASCSHFNAYGAIARDAEVDFVLHTGDYIYEYGAQEWGADTARQLGRLHAPAHEIVSLADIETALADVPLGEPFGSKVLRLAFVGRSNNNAPFMAAALVHAGLLAPAEGIKHKLVRAGDWTNWVNTMLARDGEPILFPPTVPGAEETVVPPSSHVPASSKQTKKGKRSAPLSPATAGQNEESNHADHP